MKSTGEVMSIDRDFGRAFAKSQLAAGQILPTEGTGLSALKTQTRIGSIPICRFHIPPMPKLAKKAEGTR